MIPTQMKNEKILAFLIDLFHFNFGKIPNLEKVLLWFPDYLIKFHTTYNTLMYGDGPLPLYIRFFIAIMSASCYNCDYLVARLSIHFLKTGGDSQWLHNGVSATPEKLRKLCELILLTAYTPWKLKKFSFFQVLKDYFNFLLTEFRIMKKDKIFGRKMN